MNNLTTILSEFVRDLRAQKLRTFLTVFGIVWGTVAIVVLLAFGMGFKRQLSINMHGIGESIAIMFPGSTTKAFGGFGIGRPIELTEEDAALLATHVPGIRDISPEYSSRETPVRLGENIINNIIYRPHDPTRSVEVNEKVREVLAKRYTFYLSDKDAVWIWDTAEFDKFSFYFFLAFNIFLGLIGSFTLAVGGIGVANIMYIVVQERVREIGVRRAVGARRSTILFQFFLETIFIVGLGSSIGFAIAVAITEALVYIPIREFVGTPEISIEVALATMVLLSAIGLVAGLLPARRAANLDVVECLRA